MRDTTKQKLRLLMPQIKEWKNRPLEMDDDTRLSLSMMVASCFPHFEDFAELGMQFLGFPLTTIQRDIANYMQHGPRLSMVQAQRGEAKSTLAALFAVWSLVQDQDEIVLVVSAGGTQASDVALLIIRLIEQWPLLCWMIPNASQGDRTSFEHYDVHGSLRRITKSASVSCVGITSNLPGKRATLLIPDDIESPKNSFTQPMRDQLSRLSKEFSAICTEGRILYLGTPQSKDSVYRELPSRGFSVRVWPGRYPNEKEQERYAVGSLAPIIMDRLREDPTLSSGCGVDGTRGHSVDLERYSEETLVEKELDWGPEGFELQYMLDTTLSDEARTRIKLSDIIWFDGNHEEAPEKILYEATPRTRITFEDPMLRDVPTYGPGHVSEKYTPYTRRVMAIDPAGKGGDEVAFAIGAACQSYVHVLAVGGVPGGMTEENIIEIFDIADAFGITEIHVEQNMGAGVVSSLLMAQSEKMQRKRYGFIDYPAIGQKEKRIIDTISPITRRHKLVVHRSAVDTNAQYCERHTPAVRGAMNVWYQLGSITYDRGCLAHDDRADCVQRVVHVCAEVIAIDDDKASAKRAQEAALDFIQNPMGYTDFKRSRGRGILARIKGRY